MDVRPAPLGRQVTVVVLAGLALAGAASYLDRDYGSKRIELRRASEEYGPRYTPRTAEVDHVVHHHVHTVRVEHTVEHVHRYTGGEATVRHPGPPSVIEGVVVPRAIEGGTS